MRLVIFMMLMLFLLPLTGCLEGQKWRLPFQSPLYKLEEEVKAKPRLRDKIMDHKAVSQVFARGGWLMSVLVLGGVAGIVLALWARMREGIFITIGFWGGAVLLVTLASWSYVVGLLMLVGGLAMIILMLVRWKQVADSAIDYADGLKKHVSRTNKEKVNVIADKVQPNSVKKYVLQRRKTTVPTKSTEAY